MPSITAATALVHLVSVVVGAVLGSAIPTKPLSIVAGIAFLGFAAWTLRGDRPRQAGQSKYTNFGRALVGIYDLFGVTWLRKRTLVPKVDFISV